MKNIHDKPLATCLYVSYRYKGPYGWIMIGAGDTESALQEAKRSTSSQVVIENLQIWDGEKYIDVLLWSKL